jgi:hypothetical protein
MMTHPDQLFEVAKEKVEQYQRETRLANEQACRMRHWLAEKVRRLADRLDVEYSGSEFVVRNH